MEPTNADFAPASTGETLTKKKKVANPVPLRPWFPKHLRDTASAYVDNTNFDFHKVEALAIDDIIDRNLAAEIDLVLAQKVEDLQDCTKKGAGAATCRIRVTWEPAMKEKILRIPAHIRPLVLREALVRVFEEHYVSAVKKFALRTNTTNTHSSGIRKSFEPPLDMFVESA